MHYRPRSLCSWRLYVLFCFSNFSFCGPVLGYSLVERRLCFHAPESLRLTPRKQNYLILRTSIEDGSIDNESAYLNKNSKTKYPCFLHFNHLPHGVFCFVAALPYPPFSFSWAYGRFHSKANSSKREILLNFFLLSSAQGKGRRNNSCCVLKNRCHTHCYTDSVNGFAVGDANTKIVP